MPKSFIARLCICFTPQLRLISHRFVRILLTPARCRGAAIKELRGLTTFPLGKDDLEVTMKAQVRLLRQL